MKGEEDLKRGDKPNCVCPECKATLSVRPLTPWTDIKCPECGRIFNPLIGDGELIGYFKKVKRSKKNVRKNENRVGR